MVVVVLTETFAIVAESRAILRKIVKIKNLHAIIAERLDTLPVIVPLLQKPELLLAMVMGQVACAIPAEALVILLGSVPLQEQESAIAVVILVILLVIARLSSKHYGVFCGGEGKL